MRSLGPGEHLRTHQYDLKWLSEPTFITSYESAGFVYFIFRENAVEYLNCGKVRATVNTSIKLIPYFILSSSVSTLVQYGITEWPSVFQLRLNINHVLTVIIITFYKEIPST